MDGPKKFVVIGDSGSGKTTVLRKYIMGLDMKSEPTIGASFYTSQRHHSNNRPIQIWDTAGQDRFRSICPVYYRGSSGAMCVFDVTNRASFDNLDVWIDSFKKKALEGALLLVIANKIDRNESEWKVSIEEVEVLCNIYSCDYVMTSGKEGWNADLFDEKFRDMCDKASDISSFTLNTIMVINEHKDDSCKC